MKWYVDPTGTQACPGLDGCGAATDSDEDMAWALVMADRQWGGKGALDEDYLAYAKRHIDAIWKNEVEPYAPYVLKPGDRWGGSLITNPSYFAPAYYRLFAEVSGNPNWLKVIDSSYDIIAQESERHQRQHQQWARSGLVRQRRHAAAPRSG